VRYYPKNIPITFSLAKVKERKEAKKLLTSLDKAVLARIKERSDTGDDIMGILNSCRPYENSDGAQRFATLQMVDRAVHKLMSKGFVLGK
jgi:hypothetical protein